MSHLRPHEGPELSSGESPTTADPALPAGIRSTTSLAGERFADYELIEEIARGGMGVVYRARQLGLNREVALKMILAGRLAGPTEVKRFRLEAESAAGLHHPGIVAIHEIGEHQGQPFFSMDYVPGQNLAQAARTRPRSVEQAAREVVAVAEAIHYAHQRGVLHRDLKPQNIIVGEDGRSRVTDFGLAKVMSRDSSLTHSGSVLGSPSYMAPEQAAGLGGQVGPCSDVYSLGAILYELLSGRPPFVGDAAATTLQLVLHDEPVPPRKHNPRVPSELETICLKCLEKEPARRYGTAGALADDLNRFLAGEPIQARPPSPARVAWFWVRRHPWIITGVISIFIMVSLGLAYGLWQRTRFLEWRLAHPGTAIPSRRAMIDSAAVAEPVIGAFLALGMLPLLDLRQRRRGHLLLDRRILAAYVAVALLQIGVGVGMVLHSIGGLMWGAQSLWSLPIMAVLPPFALCWFGTILLWQAAREFGRLIAGWTNLGEPPEDILPTLDLKRLTLLLVVALGTAAWATFSNGMIPGHIPSYWRWTAWALLVALAVLPLLAGLGLRSSGIFRPFWVFMGLNLFSLSVEYFTRLMKVGLAGRTFAAGLVLLAFVWLALRLGRVWPGSRSEP